MVSYDIFQLSEVIMIIRYVINPVST